jgi:hypothetical protein
MVKPMPAQPRGRSWSGPGGALQAAQVAASFIFYLLFPISFVVLGIFLIREVMHARRFEDFAIPGIIPPTGSAEEGNEVDARQRVVILRLHRIWRRQRR